MCQIRQLVGSGKRGEKKEKNGKKARNRARGGKRKNKTIYTAAPVVCGWVRAVMKKLVAKDPTALLSLPTNAAFAVLVMQKHKNKNGD